MIATLPRHCRDWCGDSQVNGGARSVGVSSTGLSRSNLAANQSVVSSASGSYQGVQDHHSKNYLKDLKIFSELFNEPLVIAKQCIREVDLDLYELLQQTELQANDLMVAAQAVTWKLSAMACNSLEVLPTLLWIARGSGEAHELSAVLEVHNSVTAMRKETQVVRTSYIDLLNQVRYLGQCTQITMDQMMIEEMPAPVEDESGSLETKRVQQQDERSFEKLLRSPLPPFPAADPGFKAPLFVTWLKPRQSCGANTTSTSDLELRGCIGCLEPIHFDSGLTEYAIRSSMKDRRFPPVKLDEVPLLTCRISILHQFEPCAHAFDWQVGVHGVLLNFSDAQGRRFSATYLPEVAEEHGMTREVAIRELVAKAGYPGPCQDILDCLEVTRYQTIVESVSYQDLASYGFPYGGPGI